MDDAVDCLFGETHEQRDERRQTGFEERVIKFIMRHSGAPFQLQPALRDVRKRYDSTTLTFEWFVDSYNFPVVLGAEKIRGVHDITWKHLFGSHFMKLPFMQPYQKFCHGEQLNPTTSTIALVFNNPSASMAQTMVEHNSTAVDPELREEYNTRIVRRVRNVTYVIESLDNFLHMLGNNWVTA